MDSSLTNETDAAWSPWLQRHLERTKLVWRRIAAALAALASILLASDRESIRVMSNGTVVDNA